MSNLYRIRNYLAESCLWEPGAPHLLHCFLPVHCRPTMLSQFLNIQLQIWTVFSAYSKKHIVWTSPQKILCDAWVFDKAASSWSANTLVALQNETPGAECAPNLRLCWPISDVWDCHIEVDLSPPVTGQFEQYDPVFPFNPVNSSCLILWRNILVILKELGVREGVSTLYNHCDFICPADKIMSQ